MIAVVALNKIVIQIQRNCDPNAIRRQDVTIRSEFRRQAFLDCFHDCKRRAKENLQQNSRLFERLRFHTRLFLHFNANRLPPVLNKESLKVSLLTETFPPEINGVSFTLARLAGELSNLGTEVQVLRPTRQTPGNDQSEWTEIDLPSSPIPNYPELRFGLPCGRLLKKVWRRDRPDIVYFATEGPAGYSGLKTCRSLGIPSVSGFHTNFDLYLKHYRISILKPIVDRYLKWFHNRTSATFAPTPWMISELREKGYNNVKMLSRGVDRDLFSPRKRSLQLRKSWGVKQKEEPGNRLIPSSNQTCRLSALTVDAQLSNDETLTLREKMKVTEEAYCWKCHQNTNPAGLPFEMFDHFGRWRTKELGKPVDTTRAITNSGVRGLDAEVPDAVAMLHRLADSPRVRQVFVRHAFRYFMGLN